MSIQQAALPPNLAKLLSYKALGLSMMGRPSQPPSAHLGLHAQTLQCLSEPAGEELPPPRAIQWLRDQGEERLANRLRVATRYRNSAAHPDPGLLRGLRVVAERLSSQDRGDPAQEHRPTGPHAFHPDQLRDDRVLRRRTTAQNVQPYGDGHVGAEPRHTEDSSARITFLEKQLDMVLSAQLDMNKHYERISQNRQVDI